MRVERESLDDNNDSLHDELVHSLLEVSLPAPAEGQALEKL